MKYHELAEDAAIEDVLNFPGIGGLANVRQTALDFEQSVGLMMASKLGMRHDLLINTVQPRNFGPMFGTDGRLYGVCMDIWRPRVIDEEFTLDARTLKGAILKAGSRIFYNTAPRPQDDTPVELSMSYAQRVYETDTALTERVAWE